MVMIKQYIVVAAAVVAVAVAVSFMSFEQCAHIFLRIVRGKAKKYYNKFLCNCLFWKTFEMYGVYNYLAVNLMTFLT